MAHKLTTILVVEDDDIDYKLILRSFEKRKIANVVVRAIDGVDALEKIESGEIKKPFIILLDLNMPRMNGQEFLREIRKHPKYSDTVVFLVTTSDDDEDIRQGFSQHVAGYFLKDNVGDSLDQVVDVINGYWQIVVLPE